jgi:uncharacterized membrane protein
LIFAAAGGLAVAAAAVLGVQYLGEQGLLGPELRVAGAGLLGVALILGGGRLASQSEPVAAALQAAGVVGLYATVLLATRVYGFLELTVGSVGLVLTTGLALALARRRGPLLGLVAVLGGFATPALLDQEGGDPVLLYGYLFLLELALLLVARGAGRGAAWPVVALLGVLGSWGWVLVAVAVPEAFGLGPPPGLVALVFVVAVSSATVWWLGALAADAGSSLRGWVVAWLLALPTLGLGLVLAAALVERAGYPVSHWGLFAALGALALGQLRQGTERTPVPVLAGLVTLALLAAWSGEITPPPEPFPRSLALRAAGVFAGLTALWAGAPLLLASVRAPAPAIADRLRLLGVAFAVPFLAVDLRMLWDLGGRDLPAPFLRAIGGTVVAGVAGAYGLLASRAPAGERSRGILLAGAAAVSALLPGAVLDPGAWPVAWAVLAAALTHLSARLHEPALRRIGVVAGALAVVALPVVDDGAGPGAVTLRLTFTALALAAASEAARRAEAGPSQGIFDGLALVSAAGSVVVGARWAVGSDGLAFLGLPAGGAVAGLVLSGELGLAIGARRLADLRGTGTLAHGGLALTVAALLYGGLGPLVVGNPLLGEVFFAGRPLANGLLAAYLLPGMVWSLSARLGLWSGLPGLVPVLRVAGLVFGTAWALLAVRQGFHAPDLSRGAVLPVENGLYSAVLVVLGAGLFVLAVRTGDGLHRLAALALLVVASGKVFLIDVAALGGLLRILSFLGLGAALLLLAWLDQRVLRGRPPGEDRAQAPPARDPSGEPPAREPPAGPPPMREPPRPEPPAEEPPGDEDPPVREPPPGTPPARE